MKKIIKRVLLVLVLLFVVVMALGMGLTFLCSSKLQNEQKSSEVVMNEAGTKSALILYQESLFGSTKKIMKKTSTLLVENDYKVTMNHPRSDLTYDLSSFDIVILASPVYMGKVATPILDYAKDNNFQNSKVLVIVTGQIVEEIKEIDEITQSITSPKSIASIKVNGYNAQLEAFLNSNL